jgi:hypothetical protein
LKVFSDDESISDLLKNKCLNKNEIISLDYNKFPKGLIPFEGFFSTSDVGSHGFIS